MLWAFKLSFDEGILSFFWFAYFFGYFFGYFLATFFGYFFQNFGRIFSHSSGHPVSERAQHHESIATFVSQDNSD
jgi:hypothetical protein